MAPSQRIVLKNGLIVDGSGAPGVVGDVLLEGGVIQEVQEGGLDVAGETLDCTGKVIAPGFIDAHSHMDWILPMEEGEEMKSPFTTQGITTFVAGNCGFGVAGFKPNTQFQHLLNSGLGPAIDMPWTTMGQYFDHLEQVGMSHNLVNLAGHGTTRASMRGNDPSPLDNAEMTELLGLLEQTLDDGAVGVSLGLMYETGIFSTPEELRQVAQLVKSKDKILTVHGRAYSNLSAEYPPKPFGRPHNVLAIDEMIDLAKETGVKLQYSHLMFAGTESQKTWHLCLETLDEARKQGVDVMTDTYSYHCGNSVLDVIIPKWFRENLPANYDKFLPRLRLALEMQILKRFVGLGYDDIQITCAGHPDLKKYEGCTLAEVAKDMGMSELKAFLVCSKMSQNETTWLLLHKYSDMEIIDALMQYDHCLFQTDAVPLPESRNPAAHGAFPLFLQYARDRKTISLETCIRKMTGATADRFNVKDRGYIKPGLAADITVFDYEKIQDHNTEYDTTNTPSGIEAVFINGHQVVRNGQVDPSIKSGQVVRQ